MTTKRILNEYFLVNIVEENATGIIDQGVDASQPPVEDLLQTDRSLYDHEILTAGLTEVEEEAYPVLR